MVEARGLEAAAETEREAATTKELAEVETATAEAATRQAAAAGLVEAVEAADETRRPRQCPCRRPTQTETRPRSASCP